MKIKKWLKWTIGILVFIVVLVVLLMIPVGGKTLGHKVADVIKVPIQKFQNFLVATGTLAMGLLFVSFGVTALAAAPIVGIALIAIGLIGVAWGIKMFMDNSKGNGASTGLQNLGVSS